MPRKQKYCCPECREEARGRSKRQYVWTDELVTFLKSNSERCEYGYLIPWGVMLGLEQGKLEVVKQEDSPGC